MMPTSECVVRSLHSFICEYIYNCSIMHVASFCQQILGVGRSSAGQHRHPASPGSWKHRFCFSSPFIWLQRHAPAAGWRIQLWQSPVAWWKHPNAWYRLQSLGIKKNCQFFCLFDLMCSVCSNPCSCMFLVSFLLDQSQFNWAEKVKSLVSTHIGIF